MPKYLFTLPVAEAQPILLEFIDYDKLTGARLWKHRDPKWFQTPVNAAQWNSRLAGTPALHATSHWGYSVGDIFNEQYKAHVLIWCMVTGDWPDTIDHINHVRNDNRWVNLRSVPTLENRRNMTRLKNNTSGCTGVSFDRRAKKWEASIGSPPNRVTLGVSRQPRRVIWASLFLLTQL
jgi:HNH endonuclease